MRSVLAEPRCPSFVSPLSIGWSAGFPAAVAAASDQLSSACHGGSEPSSYVLDLAGFFRDILSLGDAYLSEGSGDLGAQIF
jgi:hypothetical protein